VETPAAVAGVRRGSVEAEVVEEERRVASANDDAFDGDDDG